MTSSTTLTNVRLLTGEGLSERSTLVIEDGLISATRPGDAAGTRTDDGPETVVVDGNGGTLLPGLVDAHVHLTGEHDLRESARWGVTTMLDMGSHPVALVDSLRHRTGLPDIRSAGSPASAPGGMQTTFMGFPADSVVDGPDDAERFVSLREAEGSDHIKIIVEDPAVMGQAALGAETVAALVVVARAHGLRTFSHVTTVAAFQIAVDAGVDVLTHLPLDRPVGDDLLAAVLAKGLLTVPTLTMMRGVAANRAKLPTHGVGVDFDNAMRSVTVLHEGGVPVLVGTDANSHPGSPFGVPHGESTHDELALLVGAGLSPLEALRGATALPAQLLGLDDRGALEPGLRADLLLVEGDPTRDIAATRNIEGVWVAGERVR